MVIARDCFVSHNPHSHPPSHSHTNTSASVHMHALAGRHAERNIRGDECSAAARLKEFLGLQEKRG